MCRLAPLFVTVLLLTGCRGPSGECTGSAGATDVSGELGGETKMVIVSGGDQGPGRVALMLLDYGDGKLFIDTRVGLPADRDPKQIPFGPGTPQRDLSEGSVPRFRLERPEGAPALRSGVMTVQLNGAENVAGSFDVQFEDDSSMRCTFDVTGKTGIEDDQVPIEPPLGPPYNARGDLR